MYKSFEDLTYYLKLKLKDHVEGWLGSTTEQMLLWAWPAIKWSMLYSFPSAVQVPSRACLLNVSLVYC